MTLPEQLVDNQKADRNFRALDLRATTLETRTFGTSWATPGLGVAGTAAVTADRVYYGQVQILAPSALTGLQWYNGTASGNVAVALYDSSGTRVANVATPVAVTGALSLQQLAFDSAYTAAPGIYFMGIVFSGTPTMIVNTSAQPCGYAAGPGSGATLSSITPPTTPSALIVITSTY